MTNGQDGAPSHETARTLLTQLSSDADAHVRGVVVVTQQPNETLHVAQLRPTDSAVLALDEVMRAAAAVYADREFIAYQTAAVPSDEQAMWVDLAAVPMLNSLVAETADPANMPTFDPTDRALGRLRLAALQATVDGKPIVFVQSLRGNQIVARSRRIGLILRSDVLDAPATNENVLLFTRDVAAVIVEGVVLFRDRLGFERLFGFLKALQEQAEATFEAVTSSLRIEGLDQMRLAAIGSPSMLGKMASIQRKLDEYPAYVEALTMPKLVAFVHDHPECGVEVDGVGDEAQLVFHNDPQHRFKILKLLDDDYLRSELTTLKYEANSKSAPLS